MTTGLPDFFKHNLWANLRLLDVCARLSDEQLDATTIGTYSSIRYTLQHMIASEEGYVYSFTHTTPNPPLKEADTFVGLDELRRRVELSGNELIRIAEERDLSEIFYLDGGTYECPAVIVALQAINHGVDHRSQICTILTQLGIEPPCLDAWGYNDELYAQA